MRKLAILAALAATFIACKGKDGEKEPGQATITGASENACSVGETTVTLTASAPDATSYLWQKNGIDIPGETSATYIVRETGQYRACGVNSVGEGRFGLKEVQIKICRSDTIPFSLNNVLYNCYVYDRLGEENELNDNGDVYKYTREIPVNHIDTYISQTHGFTYNIYQMDAYSAPYLPLQITHGKVNFGSEETPNWIDTFYIQSGVIVDKDLRFDVAPDVPLRALQTVLTYDENTQKWGFLTFEDDPADVADGGAIETNSYPFMIVRSADGYEWSLADITIDDGRTLRAVPAIYVFFTTDIPSVTEEKWSLRFAFNDFLATRVIDNVPAVAMRNYSPRTRSLSYPSVVPEISEYISVDRIVNKAVSDKRSK